MGGGGAYLGPGAVGLVVELGARQHAEGHVTDPHGHLLFPQHEEQLGQQVQDERIIAGQLDGLWFT